MAESWVDHGGLCGGADQAGEEGTRGDLWIQEGECASHTRGGATAGVARQTSPWSSGTRGDGTGIVCVSCISWKFLCRKVNPLHQGFFSFVFGLLVFGLCKETWTLHWCYLLHKLAFQLWIVLHVHDGRNWIILSLTDHWAPRWPCRDCKADCQIIRLSLCWWLSSVSPCTLLSSSLW